MGTDCRASGRGKDSVAEIAFAVKWDKSAYQCLSSFSAGCGWWVAAFRQGVRYQCCSILFRSLRALLKLPLFIWLRVNLEIDQKTPSETAPTARAPSPHKCLAKRPKGLCVILAIGCPARMANSSSRVVMIIVLVAVGLRLSNSMKARYGCSGETSTSFQYVIRKSSLPLLRRRSRYSAQESFSNTRIYLGMGFTRPALYRAEEMTKPFTRGNVMTFEKSMGKSDFPFSRNSLIRRSQRA